MTVCRREPSGILQTVRTVPVSSSWSLRSFTAAAGLAGVRGWGDCLLIGYRESLSVSLRRDPLRLRPHRLSQLALMMMGLVEVFDGRMGHYPECYPQRLRVRLGLAFRHSTETDIQQDPSVIL